MSKIQLTMVLCLLASAAFSQKSFELRGSYTPAASIIKDDLPARGFPTAIMEWESNAIRVNQRGEARFSIKCPNAFTSFGIGWAVSERNLMQAGDFEIFYRASKDGANWTEWVESHGETAPDQTPTQLFWSHLLIPGDGTPHRYVEFRIMPPSGATLTKVRVDASDLSNMGKTNKIGQMDQIVPADKCFSPENIIHREDWWGNLPANKLEYNNATVVDETTHGFIHHGASSNTYTNPISVIQGYWNYHVNTKGWKDIGYNYVMDRYGNIYQGRYNPAYPEKEVWGAHTGSGNNKHSFAVCFMGNFQNIHPTSVSFNKLTKFMAWQYAKYDIDPLGLDEINGEWIQTVSGHRDGPNQATACPGTHLYEKLPMLREKMAEKMLHNCETVPPQTNFSVPYQYFYDDMYINFTDKAGIGSPIENRFYQALEWTSWGWRGNPNNGFLSDYFSILSSLPAGWMEYSGNWQVMDKKLVQLNDNQSNTNISMPIYQENNIYLYDWKVSLDEVKGSHGLYFFVDDPTKSKRGNAYAIIVDLEENQVDITKSTNNSQSIKASMGYYFEPELDYNFKVIINSYNGLIEVFINDTFVTQWKDSNPLANGDYVSLMTSDNICSIDRINVYKSREELTKIKIGPGSDQDIRVENKNFFSFAGLVRTVIKDGADNWSTPVYRGIKVKFLGIAAQPIAAQSATLYPNPMVGDQVNVSISSPERDVIMLTLKSDFGKTIHQQKLNVENGENKYALDIDYLQSGTYYVDIQFEGSSFKKTMRMVKK